MITIVNKDLYINRNNITYKGGDTCHRLQNSERAS